jgi:hypothetical protein
MVYGKQWEGDNFYLLSGITKSRFGLFTRIAQLEKSDNDPAVQGDENDGI